MMIIFIGGAIFACMFWMRLYLELMIRPSTMIGTGVLDRAAVEEKLLRSQIPDLQNHWNEWQRLLNKTARQEWPSDFVRPIDSVRAIIYRFILPWAWKKKLERCEQHKKDYYMLLKLHKAHEEELSVIRC